MRVVVERAEAVERAAEAVDDAAEQARRRPERSARRRATTMRSPGRMPAVSPSGTDSSRPSRNPTTSTGSGAPRPVRTSQISPTLAAGPGDSTSRPTTRVDLADDGRRCRRARAARGTRRAETRGSGARAGAIGRPPVGSASSPSKRARQLADLRVDAGVDDAEGRLARGSRRAATLADRPRAAIGPSPGAASAARSIAARSRRDCR